MPTTLFGPARPPPSASLPARPFRPESWRRQRHAGGSCRLRPTFEQSAEGRRRRRGGMRSREVRSSGGDLRSAQVDRGRWAHGARLSAADRDDQSAHLTRSPPPVSGDAGGLNVYVAELSHRLGERGLKVDVFTRADGDGPDDHRGERAHPGDQRPVGPTGTGSPRRRCRDWSRVRGRSLSGEPSSYDLVHSHYWLSGMAGLSPEADVTGYRWCTPCTPWPG